ncbi:MAG: hypothetical protein NZ551_03610 [Microscillaceae bacterium]|nr:hypothetical protein [Microscillaceae bacterium]MDW8460275.1 hypothetical protein [Cytophagales bacterium]
MVVNTYTPNALSAMRLDKYLAGGWFRSAYMLYRNQGICIDGDVDEIVNIRYNLKKYKFKKRFEKILRKYNARFKVFVRPFSNNAEKEALFQQQKFKFKGFIFNDLEGFLYANLPQKEKIANIFNTYEVAVYENHRLVALSLMDIGKNSIASLLGLYDMQYPKLSLGLYTMLIEINFAKNEDKKWYYPGYIMKHNTSFDYKLTLGDPQWIQYYDWNTKRWKQWRDRSLKDFKLIDTYKAKTAEIAQLLTAQGVRFRKRLYPFFSFGYSMMGYDKPIFLEIISTISHQLQDPQLVLAIDYSPQQNVFTLQLLRQIYHIELIGMEYSQDIAENPIYCLAYLDYERVFCRSPHIQEVLRTLQEVLSGSQL